MKPFSRSICAAAAEMEDGEATSHSIGTRTRKPESGVSEEEGPVLGGRLEGLDVFGKDGVAAAQEIDPVGTCLPERGGHGEANPWGGVVSLPL